MVNFKRKLALIISAAMALSLLASCGESGGDTNSANGGAVSETTSAAETVVEIIDFFGEDYDPFSDDYDPYGGGGVNGAKHSPETENVPDNSADTEQSSGNSGGTETAAPAANNNAAQTTAAAKSNGGNNSSNSSANSNAPAVTTGKSEEQKSSSDVVLSVNSSNSWENGSDKFTQIDVSVKNNSDKAISGWTVTIPVASGARVDQSWNCELSVSGGTLTATPVDYNSFVDVGSEGTFGMILCNAGSIDSSKATVKFGTSTVSGTGGNSNQNNNNGGGNSGSVGNNNPKIVQAKDVPAPTTDDWLYTDGSKIVDKDGKEVWLTGVNWFGYNTGTNTFDGLWTCDLNTSIAAIADRGFNLLRIPISTELIKEWSNGNYPNANFNQATNSYLVGMNSLEIFDYVIGQCRANGIKIMIDIHSAKTDSMGHMYNVWYNGNISEQDYLDALAWTAARYKNDDTIIAYDLKNEPHGKAGESPRAKWDNSKDADNWKYIAEKAAKAVLNKNPNVLVMVEGIEIYPKDIKANGDFSSTNMGDYDCTWWGGNLRGVKDNPVDLGKYQNKLVYSPHDYGPSVYEQPWFKGNYTFDSLYKDCWYDNWFYIQKTNTAPLLIGEWGGFMREPNLTWMTYLRKLIKDNRINHTFWCFNSNSGDTGGLVLDDFTTWDEEKYAFVKEVLWQQNGKFVGLDHEIPLGSNGITLSQAK
ncbi:MAG: cellulase family glycosylhydrolase [Ruminococcus sp.]|nr:cellulase family glycosylhydrolase [Ruminococcus sp.]MCM1381014.1 cellulase family glycosylhydrolase [Muribaculaceae bacterium]